MKLDWPHEYQFGMVIVSIIWSKKTDSDYLQENGKINSKRKNCNSPIWLKKKYKILDFFQHVWILITWLPVKPVISTKEWEHLTSGYSTSKILLKL